MKILKERGFLQDIWKFEKILKQRIFSQDNRITMEPFEKKYNIKNY